MAIEEFGKSLLADVRKRKDDQARDARRREERNALKELAITGVVSIGNSMLKDKANSFLETEQFYKENMQFKKGHSIANEYITNEKLAREDTLGYDAYWSNVAPSGQVDAAMTEKYGDMKKYNTADWKANRAELMKEIGMAARKNHEDGLTTAQSFINQAGDKGAEFYADFAKQSRPTTLKDLIMNKAKEALGGNDLNVASRELTRKGYLGDAQTLIAYDKAWDETGDNKISKFFADTSKKLGGAAPIIKEDFEDLGGTDSLGNDLGKVKVYKATYWDGSEKYVTPDGDTFTPEKARIHKQYNTWVGQNLGTTEAAKSNQAIGELALASHATNEERDFFIDHSKTVARKSGDRDKAIAKANRETAASIAGLKLIYTGRDYGLSERVGSRLAVAMHKKVLESRQAQRESNVLGANPYDFSNILGTALVMVEQQSVAERATDFTQEDIKEFISSPENLRAMFEDYDELTPDALKAYGNLVEEAGDPYLSMAHKRMERFINISETKNTKDLKEIYNYYQAEQMALPITAPTLAEVESTITTPVVPELVSLSKLVKPNEVSTSRGSSYLNPMSGKRYAKKAPTQLEAYNKLLALQTVAQKKKARADESTASLKPEFRNRIGTPQKASMKSIAELEKAYKDYITKYGE
jgi:hypothetical protein